MKHMMVDIETLGTSPESIILEISVILFDLDDPHGWSPLTLKLDQAEQSFAGRSIDKDTLHWWAKTIEKAKEKDYASALAMEALVNNKNMTVHASFAHENIKSYLKRVDGYIWCKGAAFDFPIIKSYFTSMGLPDPFSENFLFRKQLDLRTLEYCAKLAGFSGEYKVRSEARHLSFDDCLIQIGMLRELHSFISADEQVQLDLPL